MWKIESVKVSYERWQRAQKSELDEYRDHSVENSFSNFQKVFEYLKLDPKTSFKGKTILEVASGSVPALLMCEGVKGTIVEPLMPYWKDQLLKVQEAGFRLFDKPYEHVIMSDMGIFDETWFFNCLEHVIDPEFQMKKAMRTSNVIRMFEPTTGKVSGSHPHSITRQRIINIMGDFGQVYNDNVDKFFQGECYYGTWVK